MSKLKKEKIIAVIEKDANHQSEYFGRNEGECCVIGGLLTAAGISDELKTRIKRYANASGIGHPDILPKFSQSIINEVNEIIEREFGLTIAEQKQLQSVNDNEDITERRRFLLIQTVENFALQEETLAIPCQS